jgi:hypothetical protein
MFYFTKYVKNYKIIFLNKSNNLLQDFGLLFFLVKLLQQS